MLTTHERNNTKRFGYIAIFMLTLSFSVVAVPDALANSILLRWNPNPEPEVVGYKVYYQVNSSMFPFDGAGAVEGVAPIDVANNTSTILTGLNPSNDYYFAITAYDASGSESPYSDVYKVASLQDIVSPSVSFSSPVNAANIAGKAIITASASDDIGVNKIELYGNGQLLTAGNVVPLSYEWDTAQLANGAYTLLAQAYDANGNVGSYSVTVNVSNDKTAPTITNLSMPATWSSLNVPLSLTATDDVGVTAYLMTESSAIPSVDDSNWSASVPTSFTFTTYGTRTAYAWAKDASGKISATSSASVTIQLGDTIAPSITFLAPTAPFVYGNSVSIGASASDNVSVTKMEVYINGALKYTTSNSSFNIPWNFPVGVSYVTVKAYDAANNVQSATKNVNRFM
jgi:chitinase